MKSTVLPLLALALSLTLLSTPVLAADEPATGTDYSSYSTDELAAMRGTLQDLTLEERALFRSEWQSRFQAMDPAERQEYMGPPEGVLVDGTGVRSRFGRAGEVGMTPPEGGMTATYGSGMTDGAGTGAGDGTGMQQRQRGMNGGGR